MCQSFPLLVHKCRVLVRSIFRAYPGVTEWVAGLNLWTEDFDHDEFSRPLVADLALDFNTQTVGAFLQGTFVLQ